MEQIINIYTTGKAISIDMEEYPEGIQRKNGTHAQAGPDTGSGQGVLLRKDLKTGRCYNDPVIRILQPNRNEGSCIYDREAEHPYGESDSAGTASGACILDGLPGNAMGHSRTDGNTSRRTKHFDPEKVLET